MHLGEGSLFFPEEHQSTAMTTPGGVPLAGANFPPANIGFNSGHDTDLRRGLNMSLAPHKKRGEKGASK